MQKKPTTPPKKPTTDALLESRLKPSELRFKPIGALTPIQTQLIDPPSSKPTISIVVKTHTSKETHHCCLVGITIGAIKAPIQTHRSHRSPHVDPSNSNVEEATRSWVWREQGAYEKERRKREKRRKIMREEREISGLKRGERVLNFFFLIQFSYNTILHLRWYCSTISKKFCLSQV